MAKINFLNQADLFMSESYISQLEDSTQKKTRKKRYFIQGVMKKKLGKDLKEIETRSAEGKQEINSFKIKLQKC